MNHRLKVALLLTACAVLGGAISFSLLYSTSLFEGFGLVSSVATLIGLAYTVIQVWETKSLTRATRDAADKAILELRGNEYRYLLIRAIKLLGEISAYLQDKNWKFSALRLTDLADQCLALGRIRPGADDQWRQFAATVRWWANEFDKGQTHRPLQYDTNRWGELFDTLWEKVHRESQPFTDNESESLP